MVQLKTLAAEELSRLRDLYKVNWPLHIVTYSTIDLFIKRFAKHPEWNERVKFYGILNEPKDYGTVIMNHSGNKVYFDTLEQIPYDKLRLALITIELIPKISFICIRDSLRSTLLEVIRIRRLKICHDHGSKLFVFPKKFVLSLELALPEGFRFGQLRVEHAKNINDTWKGKFKDSETFLEDAIRMNPSMGIYNPEGDLIAWNMRLDIGEMAVGAIDPRYAGFHFGYQAVLALAQKISQEYDIEAFFNTSNGNERPDKDLRRSEMEIVDTVTWISVDSAEKSKVFPWLGHL